MIKTLAARKPADGAMAVLALAQGLKVVDRRQRRPEGRRGVTCGTGVSGQRVVCTLDRARKLSCGACGVARFTGAQHQRMANALYSAPTGGAVTDRAIRVIGHRHVRGRNHGDRTARQQALRRRVVVATATICGYQRMIHTDRNPCGSGVTPLARRRRQQQYMGNTLAAGLHAVMAARAGAGDDRMIYRHHVGPRGGAMTRVAFCRRADGDMPNREFDDGPRAFARGTVAVTGAAGACDRPMIDRLGCAPCNGAMA